MAVINRFEDIEGWKLARKVNREVWELILSGKFSKDFALSDQINRAAGSMMDNIAEGFDSGSNREFIRFLRYSQRSSTEVKSQLYRARDRGHVNQDQFNELYELVDQTSKKVGAFIRYLENA